MEIYRQPQLHVQKLLGSEEIARYEKRHTRAQLGIRQRTIHNSPNSFPSEQSKNVLTELHDGPSGVRLDIKKTLNKF
jgi:hypothetical protein